MLLSIGIVTTNEKHFLERCLDRVFRSLPEGVQTEIIVIDNASDDDAQEMIRSRFPSIDLIVNKEKNSITSNHNAIVRRCKGEYLLILDANAFITQGYISSLLAVFDRNKKCVAASGKLLKADINGSPQMGDSGRYIIDSAGLVIRKDRKVLNRGELEEDSGQYDVSGEVFGVCTAAAMFKKDALKDLGLAGEYFDESFGSHKDDVDICWKARLYGYECYYEADAVAFHCRSWPKGKKRGYISRQVRINSFKNRYLMMIKNEILKGFLHALPQILFYELKAFMFALFCEPYLLSAYLRIIPLLPLTLGKRKRIMMKKNIQDSEIMKWFV